MTLQERINLLVKLGEYIQEDTDARQLAVLLAERHNRWLTKENSLKALNSFAMEFLAKEKLAEWMGNYPTLGSPDRSQKVGIILAGNIPAVGFHDVLTTFLVGHHALIKFSERDNYLIPYLIAFLTQEDERCQAYFEKVERLKDFDAVIATGSNNSAMYFEQYFGKYPNVIRKNRNAVATLDGTETDEDLLKLGIDIFGYFGLGCRSVAKIFVPKGYDFNPLMRNLDNFKEIMDHTKYRNNYEYNRSIYLLNNVQHLANDCVMVLEHESLLSRISSVHYDYYNNMEDLDAQLEKIASEVQCVSTKMSIDFPNTVALGQTQSPALSDYADGVDTLAFLLEL